MHGRRTEPPAQPPKNGHRGTSQQIDELLFWRDNCYSVLLMRIPRAIPLAAVLATSMDGSAAIDFPLAVDHFVTGSSAHVRLTNIGPEIITAWSLATTTRLAAGESHREVETVDGYLSEVTEGLPGSSPRLDRLLPGQTREIALDPLPADATIGIVAVVLDGGTAIGDESVIASIFARRVQERDGLAAVVDVFNDVLSHQHGKEALEALTKRLRAVVEREPFIPCRAALDAVETYQGDAAGRSVEELDHSLGTYAAFVSREYEVARKHSQRRNRS